MAYQPKSYKKFVATAATATLVASAIVPVASANGATVAFDDVSDRYQDAVDYLVQENLSTGLSETEFGVQKTIQRGDAAIILASALGLKGEENGEESGFTDVPTRGVLAINALKAAGIVSGKTATRFGFTDNLTRGEVALMLAKANAYNLKGDASKLKFTDVNSRYAEAVAGMVEAEITAGKTATSFGTSQAITRGEFAIFVYKAEGSPALKANVDTLEINEEGNEFTLNFDRMIPATADVKWLADSYAILIDGEAATEAQLEALKLEVKSLSADGKTLVVSHTDLDELGFEGESVELSIGGAKATYTFEVATDVEVTEGNVLNAKTLSLDFNKELENLTDLTFTVKRGATTIVLTPALSEDKKSVTLTSGSNLVAGDYTITVTGGDFVEGTNVAKVKVEAQKVSSIEVLTNDAVLSSSTSDTVTVGYSVKDQYGTDITKEALASNITWSSSVGTASDNNQGTVSIDKNAEFKKGDTLVLTGVNGSTGTTVVASLTVSDAAVLSGFTFGDIKYPTDKTRVEVGSNPAAMVEVIGVDQYGAEVKSASALNSSTQIVTSDSNATATFVTDNNKTYLQLETVGVTEAKTVVITVVIKATGQVVNYSFDVVKAPEAAEVTAIAPTTTVAAGDAVGSLVAGLEVTDQFGTKLTAKQIAAQAGKFTITSSNAQVLDSANLSIATSGDNLGKLVNDGPVGVKGTTTVTVTVNATGKTSSFVVDVQDARVASSIELPSTLAGNLIEGATTGTKLSFKDQYAKAFDATSDIADRAVQISVSKVSGDNAGLTISAGGQTTTGDTITVNNESVLDTTNAITVAAAAGKKGSYTVTFKYVNTANNNEVLSQVSKTFVVAENISTGLNYAVKDISTLYKNGSNIDGTTGDITQVDVEAGYAQKLEITATDAQGNSYVIPASSIISVTSNNSAVLVDSYNGNWYVAGNNAGLTADYTGKVSVVVNTNDGVKSFTKDVVVSAQSLVAQSVSVKDLAAGDSDAVDINSITLNTTSTTTDSAQIWVTDQFGGFTLANDGFDSVQLINIAGDAATNASYSYNAATGVSTFTALTTPTAGEKFRVVIIEDGKSDSFDVTLTN